MFFRITPNHLKMLTAAVFLMLIFSFPGTAQAHRVTIFAYVDGNTIFTESKFGGGEPVRGGEVLVQDEAGNQLLTGKTNNKGEFSFPIPKKSALKIILNATMGHRAEWFLPRSEITGENSEPPEEKSTPQSVSVSGPSAPATVSTQEMEKAFEKVLDRKLKPLNRMLADMQQPGPSVHDVFAGIGYIFGLMGVAAWFRSRQ